ncbi:MAG TPA: 3-keto-5-aminohexanoate cleavage protein [Elusimicrobia bacterium]|nr:MAG: 3-keto-5-aminohexanoate cleavage protein [Elusimicrobia bacterium GWD2_63_28]HCC47058.1 3-keto-5-aminohexanoate cleavage protein [Elusimicrobiota bacterium]
MANKMVITCALTGAETTKAQQPALPVTPEELAAAADEACRAGAAIVHLHARNDDGSPTADLKVFKKAIDLIRAKSEVVIEITTGGAVGMTPEERIAPVSLKPDMASLDCGTVNFGDEYIVNTLPIMRQFASEMNKYGVHPTLECFDVSHVQSSHILIKEGLIKPPYHYGFVMQVPAALSLSVKTLSYMMDQMPPESYFTVMGIGRAHIPGICGAIASGGFIRVGFEDNIYYSKGRLAKSNAEFVERAVRISQEAGLEIAKPSDVRQLFKLK